jgi:hypothetical protein
MRWRPSGSGGAGQSAALRRLDDRNGIAFVAASGSLPRGDPNAATVTTVSGHSEFSEGRDS